MNKWLTILTISTLLSGCAFHQQLEDVAIDSNKLVANTANESTFMNVLRARDRMPMHFTSIRYVRGGMNFSTTAGIGTSLVEKGVGDTLDNSGAITQSTRSNGVDTFSPSLNATVSTSPNFELAIYDSEEFQNGILTPVKASVVEYYLQNGWKDDLLSALFIDRVEFEVSSRKPPLSNDSAASLSKEGIESPKDLSPVWRTLFSLRNSPDPARSRFYNFVRFFEMTSTTLDVPDTEIADFSEFKANLRLSDLEQLDGKSFDLDSERNAVVRKGGSSKSIGYRVRRSCGVRIDADGNPMSDQESSFREIVSAEGSPLAGLQYVPNDQYAAFKGKNCILPIPSESEFWNSELLRSTLSSLDSTSALKVIAAKNGFLFCSTDSIGSLVGDESKVANGAKSNCSVGIVSGTDLLPVFDDLRLRMFLRSPEGILYFLGQYVRDDPSTPSLDTIGYHLPGCVKVMEIREGHQSNEAFGARHFGKYYSVTRPEYDSKEQIIDNVDPTRSTKCETDNSIPDHRGTQVIGIVQHLINLHKKEDKLPGTVAVTAVP